MPADRSVDVLLVGGGVASVRCARELRRAGFDGSVLLVGDEPDPPYNRPPLSKELLRDDLADALVAVEPPRWYERRAIDLVTGRQVVALEPDSRSAVLDDGARIVFERCLLATGAEPRPLRVRGGDRALLLRTLADARRLRASAIDAGSGAPVVIIGGGFIGIEVGTALADLGLRPTVVEMGERLWSGSLGGMLSDRATGWLTAHGVEVRLRTAVTRVGENAIWAGDARLEAAFVVAGIGVAPRLGLALAAGLDVDDGVVTDAGMRTSHPSIWAAGDVARVNGRRIEHWHAAREGGERAARSMLGLDPGGPIPAPWVFSEVAGRTVDVVGAVDEWREERWIADGSVLSYLDGDRLVGLAVIDAAMPVERARALVSSGAGADEVRSALQGA